MWLLATKFVPTRVLWLVFVASSHIFCGYCFLRSVENPVILMEFVATSHKNCGHSSFVATFLWLVATKFVATKVLLLLWLLIVPTYDAAPPTANWVLPGCSCF
jgi:hypothetical protein